MFVCIHTDVCVYILEDPQPMSHNTIYILTVGKWGNSVWTFNLFRISITISKESKDFGRKKTY